MKQFISVGEARDIILTSVKPVDSERVPLALSLGRTLSRQAVSNEDIPPFDNSAMDGFALRAADAGSPLEIAGEIPAGTPSPAPIRPGQCARIMTGGTIPDGADAVVPVEHTRIDSSGRVVVGGAIQPGDHVRRAGTDIGRGEVAVEPGTLINPGTIGVLAALGHAGVEVAREPRVVVLTTGTELVGVSERPGPGQIRDSNGPSLAAQVVASGGRVLSSWRAGDDRMLIRRRLEESVDADVIVVSGGVSVGEYDFVKEELVAVGMEMLFWKVKQKPGKPMAFGFLGDKLVFGLPGNPVSSAVCFYEYVRPALLKMLGRPPDSPLASATLASAISKRPGLYHFVRGVAGWKDGALVVDTAGPQGSHVSSTLSRANCLVHLREESGDAGQGSGVEIEWLDW